MEIVPRNNGPLSKDNSYKKVDYRVTLSRTKGKSIDGDESKESAAKKGKLAKSIETFIQIGEKEACNLDKSSCLKGVETKGSIRDAMELQPKDNRPKKKKGPTRREGKERSGELSVGLVMKEPRGVCNTCLSVEGLKKKCDKSKKGGKKGLLEEKLCRSLRKGWPIKSRSLSREQSEGCLQRMKHGRLSRSTRGNSRKRSINQMLRKGKQERHTSTDGNHDMEMQEENRIKENLHQEVQLLILKLEKDDRWIWKFAKNGMYSVKEAYEVCSKGNGGGLKGKQADVWDNIVPGRLIVRGDVAEFCAALWNPSRTRPGDQRRSPSSRSPIYPQNYESKYWPDFPPYPCSSLGAFVNHGALRLMIPILFRCISLATKTIAKVLTCFTMKPLTLPSRVNLGLDIAMHYMNLSQSTSEIWVSYGFHNGGLCAAMSMDYFWLTALGNDYKVVALMYSYRTAFTQCTSVSTYSLKTGLWRNNVVAPPSLHSLSAKSVFVKGAIHWMGSNKRGDLQVLSFHVADEEFSYIELPMFGGGGNNGNPLRRRIFAFGDSLALMDIVKTQGFSFIWVMEKYGAVESWTRRHVINICDYPIHVSVLKNGKLWLFRTFDRQISYDTETKQTKALSNFLAHRPYFAETYLESLVLFRGAGGQVGRFFMLDGKEDQ
ncbi:hypothetical protein Ancab_021602 [Ancistrocladus abbreviatus]